MSLASWKIRFDRHAKKELLSLDRQGQADIWSYLLNRIAPAEDPRIYGDPLRKDLAGFWKYRVGSYRIIVEIRDQELVVLVVRVGNRKNVYGGH
ncbi:type II toxin-antitoxin system RelE family toxin [Desulfonatronospira thiodismutans]|uniref:type II toxin-antitoxin system RelE family toxin n=1 Tax=Desulfonatronospira thiodismutans TaxID=488939 RepID=UPI001FC9A7A6|nr:type II toxin-antitoxin system RelE/ParE family toxin [Desulfonatronospira thiodismutans]